MGYIEYHRQDMVSKVDLMHRLKWMVLSLMICWGGATAALVNEQPARHWEDEVHTIEQVVEKLVDLRNKELANATWAQNQGDRLQFRSQDLIDARQHWNQAETSREIAARYQTEIDKLETRRKLLLEKHGKKYIPPSHS